MNRRVISGAAAVFLLGVFPAAAHTSRDWDKLAAEIKTLPPDFAAGIMPQAVLDEAGQKSAAAPDAPRTWTIITATTQNADADIWIWKRRPDGLVERLEGASLFPQFHDWDVYDALGLVNLVSRYNGPYVMVATGLKLSAPLSNPLAATSVSVTLHKLEDVEQNGKRFGVYDSICQIAPSGDGVGEHCTQASHDVFNGLDSDSLDFSKNETLQTSPSDVKFKFDPTFGIFVNPDEKGWGGVADWKIDAQPWHSQILSSQLSPAQKEQARTLFARGFDLYKSGDLVGAKALMLGGLNTDPGNYLGWFTIAEIARSTLTQNGDRYDYKDQMEERVYYQHTIDLAPDSPEALLAKGYLAAL